MSVGSEITARVAWPADVPGIVSLASPDSREISRAVSLVNYKLNGDTYDADRIAAVYREACPEWTAERIGQVAFKLAYTRVPVAPTKGRGDIPTQVEYASYVLDQAYKEHEAWEGQHPDWTPGPPRIERRQHDSARDTLTNLLNRKGLDEQLSLMHDWCGNAPEGKARFVSILQVDLDDFKRINDTHGHSGGDKMLKEVAGGIRQDTDVVGSRPGGDEFIVAFAMEVDETEMPSDLTDEEIGDLLQVLPERYRSNAGIIAAHKSRGFANRLEGMLDRIMQTAAGEMWQESGLSEVDYVRPEPGASIGFAFGDFGERLDGIRHRADSAMYTRKLERKSAKAEAKNVAAREEQEELGIKEVVDLLIKILGSAEQAPNQELRRRLLEIRGDRKPVVDMR